MSKIISVHVSGGKDSTACALLAIERFPDADIRLVHADVGNEHPITEEYVREYLPKALGVPVEIVKADFTDAIDRKGAKLQKIIDGESEAREYKYPWTPESAARALESLHPTGTPFLDMCLSRGVFPSRRRQFCTSELKIQPMMEWLDDLLQQGHEVASWQGVRADESASRANLSEGEVVGGGYSIFRPILRWSAQEAIDYVLSKGVRLNDLYLMGQSRVGCMPCVNSSKSSLKEIAARFPEVIDRIEEWEALVAESSRPGVAAFFHSGLLPDGSLKHPNIRAKVEWSKTSRGGSQYSLLDGIEPLACSSAYGLCE